MIVGILKETKGDEARVAITPREAATLIQQGHQVMIEKGAGFASGFMDDDYIAEGVHIIESAASIFSQAHLIFKVKELTAAEYPMVRKGQIITGYYQTQMRETLTRALLKKEAVIFSYERGADKNGYYPMLAPMSELTGKVACLLGVHYLFNTEGGEGILVGGYRSNDAAHVTILGAGNSGQAALHYAYGLGAKVTVLNRDYQKLITIKKERPSVTILELTEENIRKVLPQTDLLINTIRYQGEPLVTREMLKSMKKKKALIVDADTLPEGAIETTRETTHQDPIYQVEGIRHIAISNYPNAIVKTATHAFSTSVTPYISEIANKGWKQAAKDNLVLKNSLTMAEGLLFYKDVAHIHGLAYTSLTDYLE